MEVPAACLNLPATRLSPRRHGDRVNGPAMSPSGQARRFELPTVTSGALPTTLPDPVGISQKCQNADIDIVDIVAILDQRLSFTGRRVISWPRPS